VDINPPDIGPNTTIAALREEAAIARAAISTNAHADGVRRGPSDARIMMVGEQPAIRRIWRASRFVGRRETADRALVEAGIDRSEVYVTNAVKHFKFEPRGKRRIHKKPEARSRLANGGWSARSR
jgi:DNA polymerase